MHRILVVEDEETIRLGLVDLLEMEGFQVETAADGELGIAKVDEWSPELVILDLMLPKKSGYEVCRYIRKEHPQVFILMLTAKTEEINKIAGLEMGADDYVTKPFSVFELMARVKSMLRRVVDRGPAAPPADIMEFDGIRLDFKRYEAEKMGQPLDLTPKEYQIMRYFNQHKGEVVSREDLLQNIWGYSVDNMPTTRTVDNQIVKLRQKIELDIANPAIIKSVRGVGYKFDPPA